MNLVEFIDNKLDITAIPNRGNLVTAHIADIHFGSMNPKTQYEILEEQFINKLLRLKLHYFMCKLDIYEVIDTERFDYASLFLRIKYVLNVSLIFNQCSGMVGKSKNN